MQTNVIGCGLHLLLFSCYYREATGGKLSCYAASSRTNDRVWFDGVALIAAHREAPTVVADHRAIGEGCGLQK